MKTIAKRSLAVLTTVVMMLAVCFGSTEPAKTYAETSSDEIVLSVYLEEDLNDPVKTFTLAELWAIAAKEGNLNYEYTGYNRHPSFYFYGNENAYEKENYECKGPTIKGILDASGVSVSGKQKISFVAVDGVTESFTAEDLFRDRYYFPNGKGLSDGSAATEAHYKDAKPAVAIMDLTNVEKKDESVLRFGQTAPNEQNVAVFNKYVADGGKIIIGGEMTEQWDCVGTPEISSGSEVLPGTEINAAMPTSLKGKKVAVYYTIDGSEPGHGDAIYNYNKYGDLNPPVLTEPGTYIVQFKSVGYSKLPSETVLYTYTVVEEPEEPEKVSDLSARINDGGNVELSWSQAPLADGYIIHRSTDDGATKEKLADVTPDCSYIDETAPGGTECIYYVTPYRNLNEIQKVNGVVADTSILTNLDTPVISSVVRANTSTKMMGLKVTWSKVTGADGYEVERTCKYSKKVSDISGGNVVALTSNGLSAGREYTFKVRAYRVLDDGTREYSEYSGPVAKTTSTLAAPALSSVARSSYNSIKLKWTKVTGATGYQIYRYNSSTGKYTHIRTVSGGSTVSYTNTGLKTGKKYSYKVRAIKKNADGTTSYSAYSTVKSATPYLTKPTISKITTGKKYATVRWNKIAGANGYKIYRSTSKNSGYKCIKTVKSGSTVSFKNTKLKSGQRYYYKVKAYRVVDKKNVYSSYSSSKYIKVK